MQHVQLFSNYDVHGKQTVHNMFVTLFRCKIFAGVKFINTPVKVSDAIHAR